MAWDPRHDCSCCFIYSHARLLTSHLRGTWLCKVSISSKVRKDLPSHPQSVCNGNIPSLTGSFYKILQDGTYWKGVFHFEGTQRLIWYKTILQAGTYIPFVAWRSWLTSSNKWKVLYEKQHTACTFLNKLFWTLDRKEDRQAMSVSLQRIISSSACF